MCWSFRSLCIDASDKSRHHSLSDETCQKTRTFSGCVTQRVTSTLPFVTPCNFSNWSAGIRPEVCAPAMERTLIAAVLHAADRWIVCTDYVVSMFSMIWIAAGPTRITKIPGKMNSTRGKIILTAVF